MRVGIGCDGAVPAAVADVLGAAGLPVESVRGVAGPAVVAAGDTQWLIASSADVSLCCESGALDAAVVGKHVLMEREPDIAELLDLRVLDDRMVYAGPGGGRGDCVAAGCAWRRATRASPASTSRAAVARCRRSS